MHAERKIWEEGVKPNCHQANERGEVVTVNQMGRSDISRRFKTKRRHTAVTSCARRAASPRRAARPA